MVASVLSLKVTRIRKPPRYSALITDGRKLMTILTPGRNSFESITCFHLLPIALKLSTMNRGPLLDETPSRSGIDISGNHLAIQPELRLLALILRMEVRRLMLSIKHANYDAK